MAAVDAIELMEARDVTEGERRAKRFAAGVEAARAAAEHARAREIER